MREAGLNAPPSPSPTPPAPTPVPAMSENSSVTKAIKNILGTQVSSYYFFQLELNKGQLHP